ncbi:metalloregulator ArsR/SmtB family transcription factor [Halanaerobium sp. Z-7514]|uniref:Metalloregulator ArsR/SmtB family transcription factor n=1 Tax=Halanaerobium polyolivorans TaxID=2886943 RepID=A0AAW4WY80_9FIRM|nr:metalloregulator ArsR/SmtB family transcription factor [Halanaerobium polyolivorans]MCC3144377.1 metalloregulator ArsR/SmtB family transcription factor [Halanaerobium polyolivorans]
MKNLLLFLKCIADENRLKILKLLLGDPYCVCQLQELLSKSQSSISQHLSYFKELDLLNERQSSKWTYYSINRKKYDQYLAELIALNSSSLKELKLTELEEKLNNLSAAEVIANTNGEKGSCCN